MASSSMPGPALQAALRRVAGALGFVLVLVLVLVLQSCAARAPRPPAAGAEAVFDEARARQIVAAWQRQLLDYIDRSGGDPAALAQLPAQRASGTLRSARITFTALDVEASAAERDGFDVHGQLLGALHAAGGEPYLFIVGIVQRAGYRPTALVDIRLVALSLEGGSAQWAIGDGDAQALQRYRSLLDASTALRFPADKDRFERAPCAPRLCVEERLTSARWSVDAQSPAAATTSP